MHRHLLNAHLNFCSFKLSEMVETPHVYFTFGSLYCAFGPFCEHFPERQLKVLQWKSLSRLNFLLHDVTDGALIK